jgi:hypothetical protein
VATDSALNQLSGRYEPPSRCSLIFPDNSRDVILRNTAADARRNRELSVADSALQTLSQAFSGAIQRPLWRRWTWAKDRFQSAPVTGYPIINSQQSV